MDQAIKESSESSLMKTLRNLYALAHPQGTNGRLYSNLILEEWEEWDAETYDTPEDFKELCDLIWVCLMYAIEHNYPIEEGMKALVDEFTSKLVDDEGNLKPVYREDGKLLKGKHFKKADFRKLLG